MTVVTPRRHRLLVTPAPRADGPYDDEVGPVPPIVDGSLALAFPASQPPGPALLLVAGGADELDVGLPDPRGWTRRLAQVIAEVLAGDRPPSQLGRFANRDVLAFLERWAGRFGGRGGRPCTRPVVCSVHVSVPRAAVAEACAVLDTGSRHRALALRLEGDAGRWRCTAIQLG